MSQMIEKYLTTRQLARLWLVSEATVKRWADAGLLPARRTAGGHRRFLPNEVARFQTERGLGRTAAVAAVSAGAGLERAGRNVGVDSELFFNAIVAGHDDAATLLIEAYLDGVEMWRLFDETVARAMHRVGELWHEGSVTVADEHFATRTTTRAVERLGVSVRRREGRGLSAICCAPEGELHELPVLCLQVLLESEGWRVRGLGANTPFFTLADAVERHRPDLVCISATMLLDLERSAREYAQFVEAARRAGARVALGGQGFRDEAARRRFDAEFHGESFEKLMNFAGSVK
ncbi:MAG TPA: B12-binding domain-containing protein [Pyrinomonadaceae bacterium]